MMAAALAALGIQQHSPKPYAPENRRRMLPREPEPSTPKPKVSYRHTVEKPMKEFTIQGHKIMAYSKKDAITRLKHLKLLKKK